MKKLSILLIGLSISLALVGCQNNVVSKTEIKKVDMMASKGANQKYKDTVKSIGDKLFIDGKTALYEGVSISENCKVDIGYYVQENELQILGDTDVAGHDEDDASGESIADMDIDYDSLGIPVTPIEEVNEKAEIFKENVKVRLIDESYYSDLTILKYSNDLGTVFKMLEVDGNMTSGVREIRIKDGR